VLRVWLWVFGGLVVIVVLGYVCVTLLHRVGNDMQEESKYAVGVTYRVEGSGGPVAIAYTVGVARTANDTAARLPWTRDVFTGGVVSLTATTDESGGTVTCKILANGRQIADQTVTGSAASVRCTGDVGLLPAR